MLQPKRTKYRKQHKGRNRSLAQSGNSVAFGEYGLKATTRGRITARQIDAARRAMTRYAKRGGKSCTRVCPDVAVTKQPLGARMGNGEGNVEYWVAKVQLGWMLYAMEGVDEPTRREAFRLAPAKLGILTAFVARQVM